MQDSDLRRFIDLGQFMEWEDVSDSEVAWQLHNNPLMNTPVYRVHGYAQLKMAISINPDRIGFVLDYMGVDSMGDLCYYGSSEQDRLPFLVCMEF